MMLLSTGFCGEAIELCLAVNSKFSKLTRCTVLYPPVDKIKGRQRDEWHGHSYPA